MTGSRARPLGAAQRRVPWNAEAMWQLGLVLRRARREANLSAARLAALSGVAVGRIGEYEAGTRMPSGAALERLLRPLGLRAEVHLVPLEAEAAPLAAGPLGAELRLPRAEEAAIAYLLD